MKKQAKEQGAKSEILLQPVTVEMSKDLPLD